MKKILAVTPGDARSGFAIAGPLQQEAELAGLPMVIEKTVANEAIGLLVLDERLVDAEADERMQAAERQWPGAIVVLPSPGKPARAEDDYARRLIRRAIGYQVRVQL